MNGYIDRFVSFSIDEFTNLYFQLLSVLLNMYLPRYYLLFRSVSKLLKSLKHAMKDPVLYEVIMSCYMLISMTEKKK